MPEDAFSSSQHAFIDYLKESKECFQHITVRYGNASCSGVVDRIDDFTVDIASNSELPNGEDGPCYLTEITRIALNAITSVAMPIHGENPFPGTENRALRSIVSSSAS